MSTTMVPKTERVRVTVCDICGGEIDEKDLENKSGDEKGYAFLESTRSAANSDAHATTASKKMKFEWPGYRYRTARRKREAEGLAVEPDIQPVHMDFHGECLINLVNAAVALRETSEREEAAASAVT